MECHTWRASMLSVAAGEKWSMAPYWTGEKNNLALLQATFAGNACAARKPSTGTESVGSQLLLRQLP